MSDKRSEHKRRAQCSEVVVAGAEYDYDVKKKLKTTTEDDDEMEEEICSGPASSSHTNGNTNTMSSIIIHSAAMESIQSPSAQAVVVVGPVPNNSMTTTECDHVCDSNERTQEGTIDAKVSSNNRRAPPSEETNNDDKDENPIALSSRGILTLSSSSQGEEPPRWRAHRIAEDYITLVGKMIFPGTYLGPFGYDFTQGQYPIEQVTALGILTSPLRRPSVVEQWSPYEIAIFEASISLYGKKFHHIQKAVRTKSTKEIIEFYYIWKKTSHYTMWKRQFEPPDLDMDSDDD